MNTYDLKIIERFAHENGYDCGVEYVGRWKPKGFDVYIVKSDYWDVDNDKESPIVGLPTLILFKDGHAQFAKPESIDDIMAHIK